MAVQGVFELRFERQHNGVEYHTDLFFVYQVVDMCQCSLTRIALVDGASPRSLFKHTIFRYIGKNDVFARHTDRLQVSGEKRRRVVHVQSTRHPYPGARADVRMPHLYKLLE